MIRIHKLIASCFGIGLVKGGGTIAAALVCGLWWLCVKEGETNNIMAVGTSLLLTATGIWSSHEVEAGWGKDSSRVVIDEAAGMSISLLLVPVTPAHVITALALFRFFDILKPLYIRKAEKLPGGWGVMMDDIVSGIYSNLVMQGIMYTGIL